MSEQIEPDHIVPDRGLQAAFLPGPTPRLLVDHGGRIRLWSLSGEPRGGATLKRGGRREPLVLGLHPSRVAGGVKKVRVCDLEGLPLGPDLPSRAYSTGLAFSPEGERLAAGFASLTLRDVASGEVLWEALPKTDLGEMVFSADGERLLATARSGGVYLLEAGSGEVLAHHPGHYLLAAEHAEGYVAVGLRAEVLRLSADGRPESKPVPAVPAGRPVCSLRIERESGALTRSESPRGDWWECSFATGLALEDGGSPLLLARPGTGPNRVYHARLADLVGEDVVVGFEHDDVRPEGQALSPDGSWLALPAGERTAIYSLARVRALAEG